MKKLICLLFTLIVFIGSWACFNETHVDKHGKSTGWAGVFPTFYNEPNKDAATLFLKDYNLDRIEQYNKDQQSDIAVNLAYLGRYNEALYILRRLQKKSPDDYNIAANLGTTYELVGKNDSALLFIKKGMQINPQSHEGSEWVHVKILEAKLHLAKNPDWLKKNRVLNTGVTFSSPQSDVLKQKAKDVQYQLQERVPFTPFPDPIMANVFDELGDLYATQLSVEWAYLAYDFSLKYDPADPYHVKEKKKELAPVLDKSHIPIPDWTDSYLTRKGKKVFDAIVDIAEKQLLKKENLEKGAEALNDFLDTISGEDEEERERKQTITTLVIGGVASSLVAIGLILYWRRKKQSS